MADEKKRRPLTYEERQDTDLMFPTFGVRQDGT